ncbi:MAG: hypothetical protein GXX96_00200 [Planctomycetaceae bacterium]|nr:hypothetical protein [Planctomycetaceae bacterium]
MSSLLWPRVELWRGRDRSVVEFKARRSREEATFLVNAFAYAAKAGAINLDWQDEPGDQAGMPAVASDCLAQLSERDRGLKLCLDRIVTGAPILQERWREFLPERQTHIGYVFGDFKRGGYDTESLANVLSQYEKHHGMIPADGFRWPPEEHPSALLTNADQKWYFWGVEPESRRQEYSPTFSDLTAPHLALTHDGVSALVDAVVRQFSVSLETIRNSELPTEEKERLLKTLAGIPEKTASVFLEKFRPSSEDANLKLLTAHEAASLRGESKTLVVNYANQGRIGFRLGGREFYFFQGEIQSFQPPPPGRPPKR